MGELNLNDRQLLFLSFVVGKPKSVRLEMRDGVPAYVTRLEILRARVDGACVCELTTEEALQILLLAAHEGWMTEYDADECFKMRFDS